MYKLEKNVPIPPKASSRQGKYPFEQMEPGDSFFTPSKSPVDTQRLLAGLGNYWAKRRGAETQFITRRREEGGVPGVRVWRVA